MADRIQQRRDTKARWEQFNPILLEGEIGYVLDDPNLYKIGDGAHDWNHLPYRGYNGTLVDEAGNASNVAMSQKGATDLAYPDLFTFKNHYLTFAGVATAVTNDYSVTDFLPISRHKQIHVTCSASSGIVCGICFYDANYKKIFNTPQESTGIVDYVFEPADIPENAAFMRCCKDNVTSLGKATVARIWSGVDLDAISAGINDIKRGNLVVNLSRNGETYTFDEAIAAINATSIPNIYQILIQGTCISYVDKYTKETLIYQFKGVQGGGTYDNRINWLLVGSFQMSITPNLASAVDIIDNVLDVENLEGGVNGSTGFYDKNKVLQAASFYNKTFSLPAGDYYIMHNPFAELHSFVEDEDGNTVMVFNETNSSVDALGYRTGLSSYADRAYHVLVPTGRTYTFKLSSMTNYFVVARRNNPGQVFLNRITAASNTGNALKKFMTSVGDGDLTPIELTVYKEGFYINSKGGESVAATTRIVTCTLTDVNFPYLVQSNCYSDFIGKVVNKAGKIVCLLNNKDGFPFNYIEVPSGEEYTLYLSEFIPASSGIGLRNNRQTKVWLTKETQLYNWIPRNLGSIIKNSLKETPVSFEKIYNTFYNSTKTISSSGLCLRAEVNVPAGIYHIQTYLGSDSQICLWADDLNGYSFGLWRGVTNTIGWNDFFIDTTDFSKSEQVTFLISGVQYGKSVNTNFPDEIRVNKVELKIASEGGGGDVVKEESYTGDVNVTPIHGQSLSLAIVHAVPPIHTYKDTFGLMFNDYVYQVGATVATLQSINPLYERNQESSAYGTATMIRRLITELRQTELSHKCVYLTAGRDGGAIDTMVKGTSYYNSLLAAMQRAAALSPGKVVKFPAVYLIQGESDAYGTPGTPYQTYYDTVKQFRADLQSDAIAILGQQTPVKLIVYQVAVRQNVENTINIQMAHLNLVIENEDFAMSTPMYILDYVADQIHINALNEYILGGYQGIAYKKCVVDKQRALPVYPKSIQKIATRKLLVRFNVPQPPLAFDNTIVSQIDNNGFKVLNAGGVNIITDTELYMDDGVILTCSEDLSTGQVCYAYFPEIVGTSGRQNGSRGNLRDSQGDVYTLPMPDGTMRRMDNYCAIFKLPFS